MIIPAVLERTFEDIADKVNIFAKFSPIVQIDFVDNTIFKGKTFLDIAKLNNLHTNISIEIHLLVKDPIPYLKTKVVNATSICTQVEANVDINEFIKSAKNAGYAKVGLSIAPQTDITQLDRYIDQIDYMQFMTITPGVQGNPYQPRVVEKIKQFKKKHPKIQIQVDGGISEKNIPELVNAGVNNFVVGSTLIKALNPKEKYLQLTDMHDKISTLATQKSKDRKIQKIGILGGAAWNETEQPYKDAFETCKLLAENGFEIVNGGGPGVMRASTKGAHAGGGRALAITYHPNKPKRHYEGVDLENDFDDEVITLDYFDRTKVMLQTTQMHVVFKGSIGTLSEFGMTWISSWIHEPDNKPIVLFGKFWDNVIQAIRDNMLLDKHEERMFKICTTPQEVLEYAKSFDQ